MAGESGSLCQGERDRASERTVRKMALTNRSVSGVSNEDVGCGVFYNFGLRTFLNM